MFSQEYHKVVSEGPPLLSMIFQRVFALQFLFCLLMILNDYRLSIHINQGLNIISLWSCNTNILYNEAEFSYSCTILAKSFNSPNKASHKKTLIWLLLLTICNGQNTIAIKSLQEKPNKPWDFSIVLLGTNTMILVKNNYTFLSQISVALLFSTMESTVNQGHNTHSNAFNAGQWNS